MQNSLIITYRYDARDGFNLGDIGESFMRFDSVLKELLNIAQLDENVQIKTSRVQHGSIDVINTIIPLDPMPFQSVETFLEFLRLAAPELIEEANTFFSSLKDAHRSVNDYFAANPLDQTIAEKIAEYIGVYIVACLAYSRTLKKNQRPPKELIASDKQINRLKKMITSGKYRRALRPITEGSTSSVRVTALKSGGQKSLTISESNVGDFLPDENMILPDYQSGQRVHFTGVLQTLQSTHGDSMKIRVDNIDPQNSLLIAIPYDGVNIEDYASYFKKQVLIDAEIFRKTMFKRPELIVHHMELLQTSLDENLTN